jgi:hypothetical protein
MHLYAGKTRTGLRLREQWEERCGFGYFTLSDNHYENNPRTANQFVADITDEALYADSSACIRLDRRASFQLAGRVVLPGPSALLYRRAHPRTSGWRQR